MHTSTEFTPTGAGVVLVCSGGGLHGAAQAGMISVLYEHGFSCDAVIGVSAGACNALYIAAEPSAEGARKLCAVWESINVAEVFPTTKRAQITGLIAHRSGVQRQENFRKHLAAHLPVDDLSECEIPVHIAAVDSMTGEDMWFESGSALDVLLASAALPGVFPPVHIDGRHLYDGGVLHALPVSRALEMDPRAIVALDVTKPASSTPVSTQLGAIRRGIDHTREALRRHQLATVPPHVATALVRTEEQPFISLSQEVEMGRSAMVAHLAAKPLRALPQAPQPHEPRRKRLRGLLRG